MHKQCKDIIELLYCNAILNSGFVLENPSEYAGKVNRMIELGFCDAEDTEDAKDTEDAGENEMEEID